MSEKKYLVTSDRVNRVWSAAKHLAVTHEEIKDILETFVADCAENPIVPTFEQIGSMVKDPPNNGKLGNHALLWLLCEWQRRCFLAPEPEVPDAIADLIPAIGTPHRENWTESLLEAYRRGKAGK